MEKHNHHGQNHEKHEHGGKGSGEFVDVSSVISTLVLKNDTFLDVGCGPGDYLKEASKFAKEVVGLDTHLHSIEKINKMGFSGVLGDITKKTPFENNKFNSILLANVLHGLVNDDNFKDAIIEIKRILAPDGRFGIVEFKKESLIGPPENIKLSSKNVDKIIEPFGFTKICEKDAGEFSYLLVFEKRE